jgi:hypothetical protein
VLHGKGEHPSAAAQASYTKETKAWLARASDCDRSYQRVSRSLLASNRYASFTNARHAASVCRQAGHEIGAITFSNDVSPGARDLLDHVLTNCSTAYQSRANALDEVASAVDGELKPSVASETASFLKAANAQVFTCITQYAVASVQAGFKVPGSRQARAKRGT